MDTTGADEKASSSFKRNRKYDVFISFGAEETIKDEDFTEQLCLRLSEKGFNFCVSKVIRRRMVNITDGLKQAIEGSKIAVIVLTKRYVESVWCLEELEEIMECRRTRGLMVLVICFDVEPSDVRKQTGCFAEAFQKHQERFPEDVDKVQRWISALSEAASLPGNLSYPDGHERKFITTIVEEISNQLDLGVSRNPVKISDVGVIYTAGMDFHVQEIRNHLDLGGSDVQIIGISGMSGVGKTTIAKAIFHEAHRSFDGSSFLEDVRHKKLVDLQEQLLSDILKTPKIEISSVDEGTCVIERTLHSSRVLVIIDDVDRMERLDALAINHSSFGLGSRIIITTRNIHLLNLVGVNKTCSVQPMNDREALQHLSWHAFRRTVPDLGYLELSKEVVDYCRGLPLALEVLGSNLCTKSKTQWRSELHKLKRQPHGEIHRKLKLNYDGLTDYLVKALFLDISCFFIGFQKDYVVTVLDSCDFYPEIGIKELLDRCLLIVDEKGNIMMHDLIRDMGREITRAESPEEPGNRSRLWHHEDVIDAMNNESGRNVIEGLALDLPADHNSSFYAEGFRKMQGLRLLKLKGVKLTGNYSYLSKELRWLCWNGCPMEVIPEDFYQPNMVVLDLSYSKLIQVWEHSTLLPEKLKLLDLSHSHDLKKLPDFSMLPNLERLILEDCQSLSDCALENLVGLSSLEVLNLKGNYFSRLPILSGLSKLRTLQLDGCRNLREVTGLPTNLEILNAEDCIMLEKMPDFSKMSCMRELYLDDSYKLTEIAGLHMSLSSMEIICMQGCTSLTDSFKDSILKGWSASGNGGVFLPGNDIPSWLQHDSPDRALKFEVPQISACDLKALIVAIVYSTRISGEELRINVSNRTQLSELEITPTLTRVSRYSRRSVQGYLWLGNLSNNDLNLESGDNILVRARAGNKVLTQIGVSLEQDKLLKEGKLQCRSVRYSNLEPGPKFKGDLEPGPKFKGHRPLPLNLSSLGFL